MSLLLLFNGGSPSSIWTVVPANTTTWTRIALPAATSSAILDQLGLAITDQNGLPINDQTTAGADWVVQPAASTTWTPITVN